MNPKPPNPVIDPIQEALPELKNFSLVLGGPLYQLIRKTQLDDDVGSHIRRRILFFCLLLWLPLLLLSTINGTLKSGVAIPFLQDVETHVRFLLAAPLMLIAEYLVHLRIRGIVAQFDERQLIPPTSLQPFLQAIRSAIAWRNSIPAELIMIAIVLPLGYYMRHEIHVFQISTWHTMVGAEGRQLTWPGLWFTWVSNPLLQFLMLRWLYRLTIWGQFLWRVSRLDLQLQPLHPDRNAGLGFLGGSAYAFSPLLAALSTLVAGLIASRIFHEGASLTNFKVEILTLLILGMILILGPLTVFAPLILAAKRKGLREYGCLAVDYIRQFDQRWLHQKNHDGEILLGTSDIQSLADLSNAFSVVREIRAVPFSRDTIVQLTWATLAPFAPLLFTLIPLEQLLDRVLNAVF